MKKVTILTFLVSALSACSGPQFGSYSGSTDTGGNGSNYINGGRKITYDGGGSGNIVYLDAGGSGGVSGNGGSGSGGYGSSGGTGGSSGSGTGGSSGGTGGSSGSGNCIDLTQNEIVTACVGNCGSIPDKCHPGSYLPCSASAYTCKHTVYRWCQNGQNYAGSCIGCFRKPAYDGPLSMSTPFAYICPGSYDDKMQDEGESDIDCGGPHNVKKCAPGVCGKGGRCIAGKAYSYTCTIDSDCSQSCNQNSDCSTQACVAGKCVNSSKLKIGCVLSSKPNPQETKFYCPKNVDGCVRMSINDPLCKTVPNTPYSVYCPEGKKAAEAALVSKGCTTSSGYLCCPSYLH